MSDDREHRNIRCAPPGMQPFRVIIRPGLDAIAAAECVRDAFYEQIRLENKSRARAQVAALERLLNDSGFRPVNWSPGKIKFSVNESASDVAARVRAAMLEMLEKLECPPSA